MQTFEDYVRARAGDLLRLAYVLSSDRQRSEDLVQDVLLKAHRRWGRIEEQEHPDSYVRRMLVNEFLSWHRKRSSQEVPTDAVPERPAVGRGTADGSAERDAARRLLAELPRQQRAVLVLRYYEDLDDETVARLLGCSASTVRTHAQRALTSLRLVLSAPAGNGR